MQPRISLITLGVADVARSRAFYERLGFVASSASNADVAFFQLDGMVLALFGWSALAQDATVPEQGSGFRGVTLAHNVATKAEVAVVMAEALAAGATLVKPAQDVFWGGHCGYFADPDGHLWEVAWNPLFPLDGDGKVTLPA
jgi:catechol 2,3-dioxygenase-like lactoylglutathione lyase family enzyme